MAAGSRRLDAVCAAGLAPAVAVGLLPPLRGALLPLPPHMPHLGNRDHLQGFPRGAHIPVHSHALLAWTPGLQLSLL